MSVTHKHNPILRAKLLALAEKADGEAFCVFMDSLSVANFRTASFLLSEEVLPATENAAYWNLFSCVVPTHSKAYLGTFLKAAGKKYQSGTFAFDFSHIEAFAEHATEIDISKTLDALLPLVKTHEEAERLLGCFRLNESAAANSLVKAQTPQCFYALFRLLSRTDDAKLSKICAVTLIKQTRPMSFNMASLLKLYFDLDNVPCTFSLQINPYELSRIEKGYDSFLKLLNCH